MNNSWAPRLRSSQYLPETTRFVRMPPDAPTGRARSACSRAAISPSPRASTKTDQASPADLFRFPSGSRNAILAAPAMSEHYRFSHLRELLAKANEEKSGDQLAGIAAATERERVAAKSALADLPLIDLLNKPLIPPETDEVSRLILDSHDSAAFAPLRSMTVGQFREILLDNETSEADLKSLEWGITPEMAAAAAKLMSNKDLVLAAAKIRNITHCRNTMGERGVLGIRLQPNHPSDDVGGILLAAFDGLLYGCGDAVIGVNPATDSVEGVSLILKALDRLITAFAIPTPACCLAHITTQLACLDRR